MWKSVEFRKTGDTQNLKGKGQDYLDYRNKVTAQITSQTAGQLCVERDGLEQILDVDDYHWREPEPRRKPHANPRCGFIAWTEQVGFYRYRKGEYVILCSHQTTTH